jgi:hypothetical protein
MIYPAFYLAKKLNRLRFSKMSIEEKRKRVFAQIKQTQRSPVMDALCSIEYGFSGKMRYPFGVRGLALAER